MSLVALCVVVMAGAPLASAFLVLVLPFGRGTWAVAALASAASLVASVTLLADTQADGPSLALEGWVYVDALGVLVATLVAVVGLLAVINSLPYIEREVADGALSRAGARHYYALVVLFLATMFAVPIANNLGAMWIAIEATTIVSALLVGIHRDRAALEAAWKYLIIGSVGIAFALFGTMMTFYAAEPILGDSTAALNWATLRPIASQLNPEVMRLAFIFVLIGYGTKAGLAPMHTWLPDAHSQAPSPVSGLLSGVLLKCALVGLFRFGALTEASVGGPFRDGLFITFGLVSLAVALPFIVVQGDLKRMLAYHSVEHMGIIVLAAGIGGAVAGYAAILHIVAHSLTKSSLFFSGGAIVQAHGTRRLHRLRGLLRSSPGAATVLMLGVFGLAGLPPFAMFVSEFGLINGAISEGRTVVGALGLGLAALAAAALLYHAIDAAYGDPRGHRKVPPISRLSIVTAAIPLLLASWIAFAPPQAIQDLIEEAAAAMEG